MDCDHLDSCNLQAKFSAMCKVSIYLDICPLTTEVGRQTVDCLLLSFDRLQIDLGDKQQRRRQCQGKWVYLFVTKAKAKAATSAAATASNGICNPVGTMVTIQLQCLLDTRHWAKTKHCPVSKDSSDIFCSFSEVRNKAVVGNLFSCWKTWCKSLTLWYPIFLT